MCQSKYDGTRVETGLGSTVIGVVHWSRRGSQLPVAADHIETGSSESRGENSH